MKRKNTQYFMVALAMIAIGLFFSTVTFLFDPFGASFYYSLFIFGSFAWMGIVGLDLRTHYNIINWEKAHPQILFVDDLAVIHASRWANVIRASTLVSFFMVFGLAPWLFPGAFLPGGGFPSVWHLISLCVMFPLAVYCFYFFSVSQTITVGKNYFKRELRGLGLRSELVSEDPHLEIEVAKHSTALVFSVANVKYKRESIFGDKVDYFDKKLVPIPDARNVPLDKFLMWLLPEQKELWSLMIDLICEPQYNPGAPSRRAQNIYIELAKKREEIQKNKGNE